MNEPEQTKIPKWVYWVIGILLALFFLQSGVILSQFLRPEKPQKIEHALRPDSYSSEPQQTSLSARRSPVARAYYRPTQQALIQQDPSFDDTMHYLNRLTQQMSQLFAESPGWTSGGGDFMPSLDFEETRNAYLVKCDIPGLDKDKLHVTVKGNFLTIQGVRESGSESKNEKEGFYSQERSYGSFSRSVMLPGAVDEGKISAEYKNGVLVVTLPKLNPGKDTSKIQVH